MSAEQAELFVIEHESGEWVNTGSEVDYSVFTSRAEAQDALDSEADASDEQPSAYKIVRFVREQPEESEDARKLAGEWGASEREGE